MPWVAILIPIFVLQIVLATIVIFFLLKTLDRNLTEMGIIRLENWPFERKIIKASNVEVLTSKNLKPLVKARIQQAVAKHFGGIPVTFTISRDVMGGIVVKINEEVLDCSMRNRLIEGGLIKGKINPYA